MYALKIGLFGLLCSWKVGAAPLTEVKLALLLHDAKPGLVKPLYPMVATSAELALHDYKQKLLKRGLSVSFVRYPMKEEPIEVVGTIHDVLKGDTVAGIGLEVSAYAAIGGKELMNTPYVMVSPYATASDLIAYFPNLLLLSATNSKMVKAMESFINRELQPVRMAAIVAWDQTYSKNFYESMSPDFQKRTSLIQILANKTSSEEVATQVLAIKPQVVILPNLAGSVAPYIRALRAKGYSGSFVGGDTWGEDDKGDLVRLTAGLSYQGYTVRQTSLHALSKRALALKTRLQAISDEEFRIVSLLYYDSTAYLLEKILEVGPGVSRERLNEAVKKTPYYSGYIGKTCFGLEPCRGLKFVVLKVDSQGYKLHGRYSE